MPSTPKPVVIKIFSGRLYRNNKGYILIGMFGLPSQPLVFYLEENSRCADAKATALNRNFQKGDSKMLLKNMTKNVLKKIYGITGTKRRKAAKKHNVRILTGSDSIEIIDVALKTFRIICKNKEYMYSDKRIKAVVIKTMDTGPDVEDMYAEIHTDDAVYLILSESPLFEDTFSDKLNSIIPIKFEKIIETSKCHTNKTFVLYKKAYSNAKIKDNNEKMTAIIDEIILLLTEEKQESLIGFLYAMLSFYPMHLIFIDTTLKKLRYFEVLSYFMGKCIERNVSDPLYDEEGIPALGFTSYDKRLLAKEYEIKKLSPKKYVTALVETEQDLLINFDPNVNQHIKITSKQLKEKVLPLIMRREDSVCRKKFK